VSLRPSAEGWRVTCNLVGANTSAELHSSMIGSPCNVRSVPSSSPALFHLVPTGESVGLKRRGERATLSLSRSSHLPTTARNITMHLHDTLPDTAVPYQPFHSRRSVVYSALDAFRPLRQLTGLLHRREGNVRQ
jgi:hypothetical protein